MEKKSTNPKCFQYKEKKVRQVGLAKPKEANNFRASEELDAEETRAFFENLYRNCKE